MHQTLLVAFIIFLWDVLTSTNPFFKSISPTNFIASELPILVDQGQKAHVIDILSGDTVRLSTGEVVRYIGVKAPNATNNGTEECFGQNALEANKIFTLGKEVLLKKDKLNKDTSGYLLRYVYRDGVFINKELVREGFIRVSSTSPNTLHDMELRNAELESKRMEKGVWHYCITSE